MIVGSHSVETCSRRRGTVRQNPVRGFTLIELIIAMAIAVILVLVAVPSFRTITLSNKLTTTASDIVGAINLARMEAVKRNASTQLCSDSSTSNSGDTLGLACGTHAGAVYALDGATAAADQVRTETVGLAAPIELTGNMVAIRFSSQGLGRRVADNAPFTGLIADISTGNLTTDNHRCIRMTAGSIITTTKASAACTTP